MLENKKLIQKKTELFIILFFSAKPFEYRRAARFLLLKKINFPYFILNKIDFPLFYFINDIKNAE